MDRVFRSDTVTEWYRARFVIVSSAAELSRFRRTLCSCKSPIRSAPASLRAWHSRAATRPVFPCLHQREMAGTAERDRTARDAGCGPSRICHRGRTGQFGETQAIFLRRRHQPSKTALASIRPGSPSPGMGPGTMAAPAPPNSAKPAWSLVVLTATVVMPAPATVSNGTVPSSALLAELKALAVLVSRSVEPEKAWAVSV